MTKNTTCSIINIVTNILNGRVKCTKECGAMQILEIMLFTGKGYPFLVDINKKSTLLSGQISFSEAKIVMRLKLRHFENSNNKFKIQSHCLLKGLHTWYAILGIYSSIFFEFIWSILVNLVLMDWYLVEWRIY